jgi:hypothetical protein
MLTEGNEQALDLVCQNSQSRPALTSELQKLEQHKWYADIIFFLPNLTCPSHLIGHKRRALRLKAAKYCIIQDGLGWRNPDGVILRCVDELESKRLMVDFHSKFCGGHFIVKTTAHKILKASYYWQTIFSKVIGYVPSPAVKDVLSKVEGLGSRGRWIAKIQEYDLEIRPTKLIKGQGLAKMLKESNERVLGMVCQINNEEYPPNLLKLEQVEWYTDIIFYLKNLTCPSHLVGHKKRALRLKAAKYVLTRDGLGWKNPDGVILRCVDDVESKKLVDEFQ